MREDDSTYFKRRAGEELAAARSAQCAEAARIHRDLADRMRLRADALKPGMLWSQSADGLGSSQPFERRALGSIEVQIPRLEICDPDQPLPVDDRDDALGARDQTLAFEL